MRSVYTDKNLQIMFGVTIMVIMGVSSITPVLPKLMSELNIPAKSIGLIISVFTLPGVFLAPLIGIVADRVGRKKMLVASLFFFGLFGTGCAFVDDFSTLLVFRFLQGAGATSMGLLNVTIIGDLFSGKESRVAWGYTTAVLSAGTAILPVIGGLLASWDWHYPFLLPSSALPLAFLTQRFLKNPEPQGSMAFKEYLQGALSVIRAPHAIGLFLITFLTVMVLFGPIVTYVPVLLNAEFDVPPSTIGIILSVASLCTAVVSSQIGHLSTRFSPKSLLMVAFCFYIASFMCIPIVGSLWAFIIPVALFGAGMGLNPPSRFAMLTALAPADQRAAVMSANGFFQRLGQTVSPVLMGLILAGLGLHAVFWAGAVIALLMLLVAARLLD